MTQSPWELRWIPIVELERDPTCRALQWNEKLVHKAQGSFWCTKSGWRETHHSWVSTFVVTTGRWKFKLCVIHSFIWLSFTRTCNRDKVVCVDAMGKGYRPLSGNMPIFKNQWSLLVRSLVTRACIICFNIITWASGAWISKRTQTLASMRICKANN